MMKIRGGRTEWRILPLQAGWRLCLGLVVFCVSSPLQAADPAPVQDLGTVTEWHEMVPMRDGVRLSAWIYLPPGQGPWPVLLEQRYANIHAARRSFATWARYGYVVVGANFRGTAQSEGVFVGYHDLGWGEKRDGYDLVEWAARQPWSNGKVGTMGGSQAGFAQNFLAVTQPPHLVAQYMTDTGLSLFHDGYRMGGATRYVQFRAMESACRVPEHNRRLVAEWAELHPTYDDYWRQEDSTLHFGKMNVPCFTLASWLDDPKGESSIRSYLGRQEQGGPRSRGKQQMIIGPWPHGPKSNKVGDLKFPESVNFQAAGPDGMRLQDWHQLRWFDHYLKGFDNGVDREPAVRYFVMGATGEPGAPGNVWRATDQFPPQAETRSFYLHAGGRLDEHPPRNPLADVEQAATRYVSDPQNPAFMPDLVSRDLQKYEQDPGVRTFTTEAIAEPVEWTGRVDVELYVASTAPDTDLIVKLCDVYPNGRSIAILNSVLRARHREGFEKEVFLQPGVPARFSFDLGYTSQIFNRGHRIRVDVASTGAPYYEPNPQTGEKFTPREPLRKVVATNSIQHSQVYASRLLAPVIRPGTKPAAVVPQRSK